MNFDVIGPIGLTRHGKKRLITKESLINLLAKLNHEHPGVSTACGCYVFAKKAGKGIVPWYVGQACKLPLAKEALNSSNREKYNQVLDGKGTPVVFFCRCARLRGDFGKDPLVVHA